MDCNDEIRTSTKVRKNNVKTCCNNNCGPTPPVTLECGLNPQDAVFEICKGHVKEHQKFVLDRVRVDTCAFCRPVVKIEFSSLVSFKVEDRWCLIDGNSGQPATNGTPGICGKVEVEVDLLFKLERTCNGVTETIRSWRYLKEVEIEGANELELEISEPFTVTFCDKSSSHCCDYRMTVEGKDFEGKFESLRVTKPDISAIFTGMCNS